MVELNSEEEDEKDGGSDLGIHVALAEVRKRRL